MRKPVLCFDFDNTITRGDLLDLLIEKYSPDDRWRAWEAAWSRGELSTRDCLRMQVESMQVSREELFAHLDTVRIDPAFARIVDWASSLSVDVIIVSDSFQPIIERVLRANAIEGVPVHANSLAFSAGRLVPAFPFSDPAFPRSANSKVRHLAPYREHTKIFAGDGRSDLDAALASDVVFAKDALAKELEARAVAFRRFDTLDPMLAYLGDSGATPQP